MNTFFPLFVLFVLAQIVHRQVCLHYAIWCTGVVCKAPRDRWARNMRRSLFYRAVEIVCWLTFAGVSYAIGGGRA